MKIAVLADIHANLVALQVVAEHIAAWQPEAVVMAGDLVTRGPRAAECLAFVQEKERTQGWLTVRGNHEDYVLMVAAKGWPPSAAEGEVHRASYWAYQQIGPAGVAAIEAMPFQQSLFDPAGREVRVVHASMRGNRAGIYPFTTDEQLGKLIGEPPAVLAVGHTHIPLVRRLGQTLVVNAGSVGLPFDGDQRTAYAQIELVQDEWQARVVRLEYDLEQTERDFYDSGYLEGAGPLAQVVLKEFQQARSLLFGWTAAYQRLALAGDISMEQSVREFLAGIG